MGHIPLQCYYIGLSIVCIVTSRTISCLHMSQLLSQNGDTPIHLVFQGELLVDYSEILHLLIHHGANVNVQNKVHVCVIQYVVQHYVHLILHFTFNVILKRMSVSSNLLMIQVFIGI